MQCSLCMCPLKLSLFLAKIFLPCECNLHYNKKREGQPRSIHMQRTRRIVLQNPEKKTGASLLYPLLDHKIPSLSTQSISDEKLEQVKWEIEYKVVQPYDTSPTPPNSFDCCKAPICIHCYQGGNLGHETSTHVKLNYIEHILMK